MRSSILKISALAALGIFTVGQNAWAVDDFGPRFTDDAPNAFGDPQTLSAQDQLAMDEAMSILNDIMPAAGDNGEVVPLIDEALEAKPENEPRDQ